MPLANRATFFKIYLGDYQKYPKIVILEEWVDCEMIAPDGKFLLLNVYFSLILTSNFECDPLIFSDTH